MPSPASCCSRGRAPCCPFSWSTCSAPFASNRAALHLRLHFFPQLLSVFRVQIDNKQLKQIPPEWRQLTTSPLLKTKSVLTSSPRLRKGRSRGAAITAGRWQGSSSVRTLCSSGTQGTADPQWGESDGAQPQHSPPPTASPQSSAHRQRCGVAAGTQRPGPTAPEEWLHQDRGLGAAGGGGFYSPLRERLGEECWLLGVLTAAPAMAELNSFSREESPLPLGTQKGKRDVKLPARPAATLRSSDPQLPPSSSPRWDLAAAHSRAHGPTAQRGGQSALGWELRTQRPLGQTAPAAPCPPAPHRVPH